MTTTPNCAARSRPAIAALIALGIIQAVMLASLFAGVAPHPPATIPLFAMAPFLAVSVALTATGGYLLSHDAPGGRVIAVLAALAALLSFGPQKYFDPAFPEIWIAVIASQLAVLVVLIAMLRPSGRAAA